MVTDLIPVRCKEFLNASWWYFVGPLRPEGAERSETSLFIQKVFDCKGYKACKSAGPAKFLRLLMEEDPCQGGAVGRYLFGLLWLSWSGSFIVGG
jgi:hypothetical protein